MSSRVYRYRLIAVPVAPPLLQAASNFGFAGVLAGFVQLVAFQIVGQEVLQREIAFVGMGLLVFFSVTDLLHQLGWRVA